MFLIYSELLIISQFSLLSFLFVFITVIGSEKYYLSDFSRKSSLTLTLFKSFAEGDTLANS